MDVMRLTTVAEKFGIHTNTVYEWMKKHGFPKPFEVGGTKVWDAEEVNLWIAQQKEKRDGSHREAQGTVGLDV